MRLNSIILLIENTWDMTNTVKSRRGRVEINNSSIDTVQSSQSNLIEMSDSSLRNVIFKI